MNALIEPLVSDLVSLDCLRVLPSLISVTHMERVAHPEPVTSASIRLMSRSVSMVKLLPLPAECEAAIISAISFAWRLEVTSIGVYMSRHRSLAERLGRFALFS